MSIYLIRHGQSEFNAAHKHGSPDPIIWDAPLSELGRDAGISAEILRSKFPDLSFDGLADIWWHQGPENEHGVPVEPREPHLN